MILVSKYTSIKQLVYGQMGTALSIYSKKEKIANLESDAIVRVRKRGINKVLYRSHLALKMSKLCGMGARELAANLASHFRNPSQSQWQVSFGEPGWVEIEIMPGLIAAWLQARVDLGQENENGAANLENIAMHFDAQYAHARCCGLIRLAVNEGLIAPVDSETQIPWCDREMLRFQEPAAWDFLGSLIDVTDALGCEDNASVRCWQKYAGILSVGFDRFWRECNIFGTIKNGQRELALARLGLVGVARSVFKELLETKLGQAAVSCL